MRRTVLNATCIQDESGFPKTRNSWNCEVYISVNGAACRVLEGVLRLFGRSKAMTPTAASCWRTRRTRKSRRGICTPYSSVVRWWAKVTGARRGGPISRVRRGEQPRRCWANPGPSRSWPELRLAARRRSAVPLRRHVQRSGRRGGRNPLVGCLGDQVDNPLIGLPDDATGRSGVCVRLQR